MNNKEQKGAAVVSLLVLIFIVSLLIVTVSKTAVGNYRVATTENARVNAQFAADSGLDYGILKLTEDETWIGESDVTLSDNEDIRTTYSVEIFPGSTDKRLLIRSTGKAYTPEPSSEPLATRVYQIEVENILASNTSIVAGVGGLVMGNSSKIVDGSVFVNGEITMSNTAQIGTSTNPLQIFVANKVCPIPADATFPVLCNSGQNNNPITIGSPNAYIYGEVSANYQYDNNNMININNPSSSAIVANNGVTEQPLPLHDRSAMIDSMPYSDPQNDTGTPASTASCTSNNGTKIWGPNEKITGNVEVSKKCRVEIRGDVWIDGTLTMRNSGEIKVADSLGMTRPTIMIDGQGGFEMNQSAELVQNSAGINAQIITYWSQASCSPNCTDVTGVDLRNSQDVTTINIVNAGDASEAIFYSKWSKVIIRNSVNVGALVGQVVELEQSATIAFSSQVPGFTPTKTWVKKGYLRVFQ